MLKNVGGHQYLDYINVMAYDYYWTGYEFTMDLEALNNLGITNVIIGEPSFVRLLRVVIKADNKTLREVIFK